MYHLYVFINWVAMMFGEFIVEVYEYLYDRRYRIFGSYVGAAITACLLDLYTDHSYKSFYTFMAAVGVLMITTVIIHMYVMYSQNKK